MAGGSPSGRGDATSTGDPVKASTTEVPSTPDELAKRENQITQLMMAMEESRAREERMTQMLYEMQQQLNAPETQQEKFSQKALKDQQDLQKANVKLEESLKLERERTTAMLREPSPKGRQDVGIYVTDDRRSVQLDLHLSLRDKVDTIYTQCKEISAQRAFILPKEDE